MLNTHHVSFHMDAFAALISKESAVKSERAVKESATYWGGKPSPTSCLIPKLNFIRNPATYGHDTTALCRSRRAAAADNLLAPPPPFFGIGAPPHAAARRRRRSIVQHIFLTTTLCKPLLFVNLQIQILFG